MLKSGEPLMFVILLPEVLKRTCHGVLKFDSDFFVELAPYSFDVSSVIDMERFLLYHVVLTMAALFAGFLILPSTKALWMLNGTLFMRSSTSVLRVVLRSFSLG